MRKFKHISAKSVEDAASTLKNNGKKARIIAGGTDLLGEMKDDILPEYPEVIVDVKTIPGLDYIKDADGGLQIGALTRLEDIANHPTVKERYFVLAEAAHRTASPHIREMGTIAGNICQNNRCWYYWVPDNRFNCLRKGGKACYALIGDNRYHSIFGANRINATPCTAECPDNVNIPEYMSKIREGNLAEAARILMDANPIPAITGRVCPHFCEGECNRGGYDESVSIRGVERYLGNYILSNADQVYKTPQKGTGRRVAIVGSGPAGLSAIYYLRKSGHKVTVFESQAEPGGQLIYGIPPYRLPKEIVRKQVQALAATGVEFKTETSVDRNKLDELMRQYDAVLLACGTWKERPAGIPGEQYFISGSQFLAKTNLGSREIPGKKVAVIGGGNVALDVARTLLRLGAEPVIIYRRTRTEMPALADEVEKAEQEGVKFEFLTLPVSATKTGSKVSLKCSRMKLGPPDESGRPRPVAVSGSEFTTEYDGVIAAIGEGADYSLIPTDFLDASGKLKINESNLSLGKNVFAGGDFGTGPATVVAAIAAGRKAASAIDNYLMGREMAAKSPDYSCQPAVKFNNAYLQKTPREKSRESSVSERVRDLYSEETGNLEEKSIGIEANRCFNCGCIAVNSSDIAPVLIALNAKIKTSKRVIAAEDLFTVGVDKTTVLDTDELVLEIQVPRPAKGLKTHFDKFAIRKSIDFPIVNCASAITSENGTVKSARICLNSVYNLPYRVKAAETYLTGKTIDEAVAEKAADAGMQEAFPVINNKYKIQIARTLVKRAILACKSE